MLSIIVIYKQQRNNRALFYLCLNVITAREAPALDFIESHAAELYKGLHTDYLQQSETLRKAKQNDNPERTKRNYEKVD